MESTKSREFIKTDKINFKSRNCDKPEKQYFQNHLGVTPLHKGAYL